MLSFTEADAQKSRAQRIEGGGNALESPPLYPGILPSLSISNAPEGEADASFLVTSPSWSDPAKGGSKSPIKTNSQDATLTAEWGTATTSNSSSNFMSQIRSRSLSDCSTQSLSAKSQGNGDYLPMIGGGQMNVGSNSFSGGGVSSVVSPGSSIAGGCAIAPSIGGLFTPTVTGEAPPPPLAVMLTTAIPLQQSGNGEPPMAAVTATATTTPSGMQWVLQPIQQQQLGMTTSSGAPVGLATTPLELTAALPHGDMPPVTRLPPPAYGQQPARPAEISRFFPAMNPAAAAVSTPAPAPAVPLPVVATADSAASSVVAMRPPPPAYRPADVAPPVTLSAVPQPPAVETQATVVATQRPPPPAYSSGLVGGGGSGIPPPPPPPPAVPVEAPLQPAVVAAGGGGGRRTQRAGGAAKRRSPPPPYVAPSSSVGTAAPPAITTAGAINSNPIPQAVLAPAQVSYVQIVDAVSLV